LFLNVKDQFRFKFSVVTYRRISRNGAILGQSSIGVKSWGHTNECPESVQEFIKASRVKKQVYIS